MPQFELQRFAEGRLNKGMVTTIDPADLELGAVTDAKNFRVRYDKALRRFGYLKVVGSGVAGPALPVREIFQFRKNDLTKHLIVIHSDGSLESETGGVWVGHSGNTGGVASTMYQAATVNNKIVIAVDGLTKLKDPYSLGLNQVGDLSASAPVARFITGFFNRIYVANYPAASPVQIGWSGDGNIEEFDPLVDETAGSGLLMDSPADMGDPVMGIVGMDNILFIPREQSLWLGTKQPIATNPVNFISAVPGIGTNAPYSVARMLGGAAFADTRTGTIWFFDMRSSPIPIGQLVEKTIFRNLSDPNQIKGTYNATTKEYSMYVPSGQDYNQIWVYNFLTKAWTYDEVYQVTALTDYQYAFNNTSIDDLVGTIDSLAGTIDNLGIPITQTAVNRLYGKKDGSVHIEDTSLMTDNGSVIDSQIITKEFQIPKDDMYVAEFHIEYNATVAGTLQLWYAKNGGFMVFGKSFTLIAGKPALLRFRKNIKARKISWMLRSLDGAIYDILSYQMYVYASGDSNTTKSTTFGGV